MWLMDILINFKLTDAFYDAPYAGFRIREHKLV